MLSYLRKKTVDEDRIIVEKSVTATENKTCMTGKRISQILDKNVSIVFEIKILQKYEEKTTVTGRMEAWPRYLE